MDLGDFVSTWREWSESLPLPTAFTPSPWGGILFSDGLRLLSTHKSGKIFVVCGAQERGYQDGKGEEVRFQSIHGLCTLASGDVLISDTGNHRIRVLRGDGSVSAWAGTGVAGLANGEKSTAQFHAPRGLCLAQNEQVYVADSMNNVVRLVCARTGMVRTVAGTGVQYTRFGHGTLSSSFYHPRTLCLGSDNEVAVACECPEGKRGPILAIGESEMVWEWYSASDARPVLFPVYHWRIGFRGALLLIHNAENQPCLSLSLFHYFGNPHSLERPQDSQYLPLPASLPPSSSLNTTATDAASQREAKMKDLTTYLSWLFDLSTINRLFQDLAPCILPNNASLVHVMVEGNTKEVPLVTFFQEVNEPTETLFSLLPNFPHDNLRFVLSGRLDNLQSLVFAADPHLAVALTESDSVFGLREPLFPQIQGKSLPHGFYPAFPPKIRICRKEVYCVVNIYHQGHHELVTFSLQEGVSFKNVAKTLKGRFPTFHLTLDSCAQGDNEGQRVYFYNMVSLETLEFSMRIGHEGKPIPVFLSALESFDDFITRISIQFGWKEPPRVFHGQERWTNFSEYVCKMALRSGAAFTLLPRLALQPGEHSYLLVTLIGTKYEFSGFNGTDTTDEVRMAASMRLWRSCDSLRLIYQGRGFISEKPLSEYNMEEGQRVHLVLRVNDSEILSIR